MKSNWIIIDNWINFNFDWCSFWGFLDGCQSSDGREKLSIRAEFGFALRKRAARLAHRLLRRCRSTVSQHGASSACVDADNSCSAESSDAADGPSPDACGRSRQHPQRRPAQEKSFRRHQEKRHFLRPGNLSIDEGHH